MKQVDSDLIIHVGLHKTGSTTIQNFLHSQQTRLLSCGILYPSTGLFHSQHALIPASYISNHLFIDHGSLKVLSRSHDPLYYLNNLYLECCEKQSLLTIISSEVFCEIPSKEDLQDLLLSLVNQFSCGKILICTRDRGNYGYSCLRHAQRVCLPFSITNPIEYFNNEMIRRDNFIAFFNSTGIKIIEKDFEGAISSNMVDYYLGDIIKNYSTEACSILNEYDVRQEIGMNSDPYPPIFYAFLILFGDQIVTHFGDRAKVLDLQATIYKEIQALNNQELSLFTSKRIQSWIDSMLLTEQQIEPSFQEKQHMLTLQGMDPALLATIFNKLSMY